MNNYEINEKEELLSLLRYIEKMMRINPQGFINSPEYKEKINRFNSLSSIIGTLNLTPEETKEANELWESLKVITEKYNKQSAAEKELSPQETLLKALKDITEQWDTTTTEEKRLLVEKIARLQTSPTVLSHFTTEESDEYNRLMGIIRNNAVIEQIPLDEFDEIIRKTSGI